MNNTIWTLPIPSTQLLNGVSFTALPMRRSRLAMQYEDDVGVVDLLMTFEGVEVFKCTYFSACTAGQIAASYDKLISVEASELLTSLPREHSSDIHAKAIRRHLAIFFDEGPYYEFICRGVAVERGGVRERISL